MKRGDILVNSKGIKAKIVDISIDGNEVEIYQSNGYRIKVNRRQLQKEIKEGRLSWKVKESI